MKMELAKIRTNQIVNLSRIYAYEFDHSKIADGISYLVPKLDIALRNAIDSQIMAGIKCFADKVNPVMDYEKAIVAVLKRWYQIQTGAKAPNKDNKMKAYNSNLLMTVVEVTNQEKEDAIGLEISRDSVFEGSLFHHTLRSAFNCDLCRLKKLKLVTLTRKTVALTQKGFEEAWG